MVFFMSSANSFMRLVAQSCCEAGANSVVCNGSR